MFKVFAMGCIFAAMGIGFLLILWFGFSSLDQYVKKNVPIWERASTLKLIDPPPWVNNQIKERIYAAAAPDGDLKPDEETARLVQNNIAQGTAWLDKLRVQTTHDSIQIKGRWRKPLAMVKSSRFQLYLDPNLVVLDFVPIPVLPIVRIEGLPVIQRPPPSGTVWQREDLAAAVAILTRLNKMDELDTPDKPLLFEIASIDITNFKGRSNSTFPHIVLYSKDNTEIIWGAELDAWQQHFESTDEQKLAKLYYYYKRHGSLSGGVKYINLCDPQDNVPRPIDKF